MTTATEFRIGRRIIKVDEVVKIDGERGDFAVKGFDLPAGTVSVYGGTPGRARFRTFYIHRIGARPVEANRRRRVALAGKANR